MKLPDNILQLVSEAVQVLKEVGANPDLTRATQYQLLADHAKRLETIESVLPRNRELPTDVVRDLARYLNRVKGLAGRNDSNSITSFLEFPTPELDEIEYALDIPRPERMATPSEALTRRVEKVEKTLNRDFAERIQRFESNLEDLENNYNQKIASLQEMEEAGRTALGQIGVDRHAKNFDELRKQYQENARFWLKVTLIGLFVGVTTPFLFWFLLPFDEPLPGGTIFTAVNVSKGLTKLVVLFTLFYTISIFIRNYKAYRHLEIISEHRSTSLSTFRSFVEGAEGDETIKKQLLLTAANTIFIAPGTGFVEEDKDGPIARVVEILGTVRGK